MMKLTVQIQTKSICSFKRVDRNIGSISNACLLLACCNNIKTSFISDLHETLYSKVNLYHLPLCIRYFLSNRFLQTENTLLHPGAQALSDLCLTKNSSNMFKPSDSEALRTKKNKLQLEFTLHLKLIHHLCNVLFFQFNN